MLWPGRKQVFRCYDDQGRMLSDLLSLEGDHVEGEALIRPMMKAGRRLWPAEPLEQSRQRALRELNRLPEALKRLEHAPDFPVVISEPLKQLARDVDILQAQSVALELRRQRHFKDTTHYLVSGGR